MRVMQHHLQSHTRPARPAHPAVHCSPHRSHPALKRGRVLRSVAPYRTTGLSEPAEAPNLLQQLTKLAAATSLSISLIAQPCMADELSFAFPASANPDIREAQKTLVESWAYVDTVYVDGTDHSTWAKALQDALAASFKAKSADEVTQITRDLLAQLDDPYTRLLQEEEEEALAAEEEGKIVATGLGLQQLSVPSRGPEPAAVPSESVVGSAQGLQGPQAQQQQQQLLVVSFVIEGSPAAQAGVQEGDAVLTVSGQSVEGKSLRDVYKLLAKEADVTLARQPPLPDGSSSDNTTGSNDSTAGSAASSNSSSSSGSGGGTSARLGSLDVTDAAAAGVFSASAGDSGAVISAALLQGVEQYTVSLKPQPLEFEAAQYGIIDLRKAFNTVTNTGSTVAASRNSAGSNSAAIATAGGDTVGGDAASTLLASATATANLAAGSAPAGSSDSANLDSSRSSKVGYLKVLTFSTTAPQAVAEALLDMQKEGAQEPGGLAGLIVDLRDNPGGIVEAGVDIAQDFLRAGQVLCIASDKSGQEERVVLPEAHTLTDLPLVVLVNHSTASTSELLAGALHDELRAPLIGTTTYGKGRTQRVIRLADGKSTLLVSTLKYLTPAHVAIDNVGLAPDVVCEPEAVLAQQWQGGKQEAGSLLDDPCIKLAAERLTGVV